MPIKPKPAAGMAPAGLHQQISSIMEVHHHPDLHHKKKKFKEYVAEFLMIFLAVTMGFFAETIREKISESHREKDYISGLVNNIKSDTASLAGLIERNELELRGIDTLMKVSKSSFTNTAVQDSIFYYSLQHGISLHLFEFNDLTLVQLRNAGGYSLIKTDNVADSIALYESKNNDIKLQEKFVTDYYIQTWGAFKFVFDGTASQKFGQYYAATGKIPSTMAVLISKEPEKMNVFINNFWEFSIVVNGYKNLLKQHLAYLDGLLAFLKQTYHIK